MIIEAFLRWLETANTQKKAEAAYAVGRAFIQSALETREKRAAELAITYLLDDPSPKVRLALCDALAGEKGAPRSVVLALASDQPEISVKTISHSPVLSEADLINLAATGGQAARMAIAARSTVSAAVAAAVAEIGQVEEIAMLLNNDGAHLTPNVLVRLANRLGHTPQLREILLDRDQLPAAARQILIEKVGEALSSFGLVRASIEPRRIERIRREACDSAIINVLSEAGENDIAKIAEHLRIEGRLTTAFLVHSLCAGRTDFFAEAISNLSGVSRNRVRSILASGRNRAVRALIESAGIARDVSAIFSDAVDILRAKGGNLPGGYGIFSELSEKYRGERALSDTAGALLDFIERLGLSEMRLAAHRYAADVVREAA